MLVGIGGGIPCHEISDDPPEDVHLGDVVVGWPGDLKIVDEFLDILTFPALAIVQAVAFINKNNSTTSAYISLYKDSGQEATDILVENLKTMADIKKQRIQYGTFPPNVFENKMNLLHVSCALWHARLTATYHYLSYQWRGPRCSRKSRSSC